MNHTVTEQRYACVSNAVFDASVSFGARAVYAALCLYRNSRTERTYVSLGRIARDSRLCVSTTRRVIDELELEGLISVERRHLRQLTNVYTIPFERSRGYFKLPVRAFDRDVPTIAKVLWMRIARFAGGSGSCYSLRRDAARECGMSRSSVDRARRVLAALGIVEVEAQYARVGDRLANRFRLLLFSVGQAVRNTAGRVGREPRGASVRAAAFPLRS